MANACLFYLPHDIKTLKKILNIFKLLFLKNNWPFEAKFHMEPPSDGVMKICSNVPGHVTKMTSNAHIW